MERGPAIITIWRPWRRFIVLTLRLHCSTGFIIGHKALRQKGEFLKSSPFIGLSPGLLYALRKRAKEHLAGTFTAEKLSRGSTCGGCLLR